MPVAGHESARMRFAFCFRVLKGRGVFYCFHRVPSARGNLLPFTSGHFMPGYWQSVPSGRKATPHSRDAFTPTGYAGRGPRAVPHKQHQYQDQHYPSTSSTKGTNMGRGEQADLNQNAQQGRTLSNTYSSQASQLYPELAATLTQEINNPQGYSPQDLAAMNTSVMQGTGGATAGVVGQGMLEAARTRNVGGSSAAL